MRCHVCGEDTSVKDSRLTDSNTIRRRRVCSNGHRFSTWESTTNSAALVESRKKALRTWKAKQDMQAVNKRHETRRLARIEAKATGKPVEEIYQHWGVA